MVVGVRVRAPITGVCQVKGCWMNLGKTDKSGNPPLFVKFKDYGFFMPKDATGRVAIVEGTMTMKQETVAETKHYLEDAGKHEAAKSLAEKEKEFQKRLAKAKTHLPLAAILKGRRAAPQPKEQAKK